MLINPISQVFNVYGVKRNEQHRHTPVLNNDLPQDTVSFSGAMSQLSKEELKLKNRLFKLIYNKNQALAQDAAKKLGIEIPEDDAGRIALVKDVAHNIRLIFASICRKDKNPQVRLPQTPEEEKAVIEFLENRAPLDKYLELMEEKANIERKITKRDVLMGKNKKSAQDIQDLGKVRDELDEMGDVKEILKSLNKAIRNERLEHGKEIEFLERIDRLEEAYKELKLITPKEINEFYDSFNKQYLNRDINMTAQELLDIFRNGKAADYAQTTKAAEAAEELKAQKAARAQESAQFQQQIEAARKQQMEIQKAQRRDAANRKNAASRIARENISKEQQLLIDKAVNEYETKARQRVNVYRANFKDMTGEGDRIVREYTAKYTKLYPNILQHIATGIQNTTDKYNKTVRRIVDSQLEIFPMKDDLNYLTYGIHVIKDERNDIRKLQRLLRKNGEDSKTRTELEEAKERLKKLKAKWLEDVQRVVAHENYNRQKFIDVGRGKDYDYLTEINDELVFYRDINRCVGENNGKLPAKIWDDILSRIPKEDSIKNVTKGE